MGFLVSRNDRTLMRHAVDVRCQIVRERDYKLVATRSLDLSPQGILVPSEADVAIGEAVMVSFKATDLGLLFAASGKVARIVHGRRPGDTGRCLGVSFKLDAISRHVLRGGLRRVPPPIPKRDRRIDYAATINRISDRMDVFYFD